MQALGATPLGARSDPSPSSNLKTKQSQNEAISRRSNLKTNRGKRSAKAALFPQDVYGRNMTQHAGSSRNTGGDLAKLHELSSQPPGLCQPSGGMTT